MNEQQGFIRSAAALLGSGQGRVKCPYCSNGRKNKHDTSLSITVDDKSVAYNCWHCNETGHVWLDAETVINPLKEAGPAKPAKPVKVVAGELSESSKRFLGHRGIRLDTAVGLGLFTGLRYSRKAQGEVEAIGFPYCGPDNVYAVKYRCIEPKDYSWDGSPASLWGVDRVDLTGFDGEALPLIICEGEIDALTLSDCGVMNATSVPNGAPAKVNEKKIDPKNDKLFSYLWAARDIITAAEKVIICADADQPGAALAEEIARRVGRAKCWQVGYPDDCKDINDVLLKHGRDAVGAAIEAAQPWPVAGLFSAEHYHDKVDALYRQGPGKGESTGYLDVDDLYTIGGGFVSVVTGIPGAGKSEFVDQIMFNLARDIGWKFAVCSFENPPDFHIPKLAEKYTGKPFFQGPTQRMTTAERDTAFGWVNDHFIFMDSADGEPSTIDSILDRAAAAVLRLGVRGLVIDPFNYVEMDARDDTETNIISSMLTKIRLFAISHDVHVWFIAHPRILRSDSNLGTPIPKGYDISGSAAWFSKADFGVTVARPWMHSPVAVDDFGNKEHTVKNDNSVEIHIWKCRFKWLGSVGTVKLQYDPANGRYSQFVDWGEVEI